MRPLLWKEMRDLRAPLLAGAAATGLLEVLLVTRVFGANFLTIWMLVLMPFCAALAAIGLAARQIARERHNRTLDYLLVRPTSASVIVWAKFLAGTLVLALLLACVAAPGYTSPEVTPDISLQVIREQAGFGQLLVTLFPRFWCLYAVALFFSVLVDRSAKAAALAGVVAIVLVAMAVVFVDLAPFSGFVFWLPFVETSGGLVEAARSWRLSLGTGMVYVAGALLVTAVSATLLKRSPERYLGNRGVAVVIVGVIAVAVASAQAAAHRLPEIAPTGFWEFPPEVDDVPASIAASGNRVALTTDKSVVFLDFSEPTRPVQTSEVTLLPWSPMQEWGAAQGVMEDGTLYLLSQKKQLPVDDLQIAIVKPAGVTGAISLGPVRPGESVSTPVLAGGFVYVGITRERASGIRTFDLASGREMAALEIDRLLPPVRGIDEGSPPVRMVRRGAFLYVSSPSHLTAIDIANPAQPRITSQLPVRASLRSLYGFPRPLAWQDDLLFEIRLFPQTLASYDLSDPAHPKPGAGLTLHDGVTIAGSGHTLYRPWRSGVMEFRAVGDHLQAQRYLRGDRDVAALAVAGDSVYVLTTAELHERRRVRVFRVRE
jgi:hypothetical protein